MFAISSSDEFLVLYAADVIPTAQHYGFQVHSYADDTQLYQ